MKTTDLLLKNVAVLQTLFATLLWKKIMCLCQMLQRNVHCSSFLITEQIQKPMVKSCNFNEGAISELACSVASSEYQPDFFGVFLIAAPKSCKWLTPTYGLLVEKNALLKIDYQFHGCVIEI